MLVQWAHVGTVTMRKTFAMDDGDDDPDDDAGPESTSNDFLRFQAAYMLQVDLSTTISTIVNRLFDLYMFLVKEGSLNDPAIH